MNLKYNNNNNKERAQERQGKKACKQASKQASRQADKQAGKQTGKQKSKEARRLEGKQALGKRSVGAMPWRGLLLIVTVTMIIITRKGWCPRKGQRLWLRKQLVNMYLVGNMPK